MKSKSYKIKPLTLSIATAVAVGLGANAGFAQRQIEEVVVTAERREATEQTTSISMEVFTQDALSANSITELQDLQDAMPGIQITNNGVGNDINIRGVGNNTFSPSVQMGVQVVNDGLTHGEPMGLNGGFFDVGTIEVLRGPQGTFVGQSAAGGAILINSANPNFDGINGYVEGRLGNYQHNAVTGALNLPMSDTWAARIAWNTEERDSYFLNTRGQIYGNGSQHSDVSPGILDNRQVRLSLLWQPTDQFEAVFKVEQNAVNHGGDHRKPKTLPLNVSIPDPVTGLPVAITTFSQYREYSPTDPFELSQNFPSTDNQENQQWSMRLTYEFQNGMTIMSNTGHNKLYTDQLTWLSGDTSGGNNAVPIFPTYFSLDEDNRSWTQEINIASADGPTNWIVGLFHQQRVTPVNLQIPGQQGVNQACGWQNTGVHVPCGALVVPSTWTHIISPAAVEHDAIFGQYNYAITDELELAIGARYNFDDSHRQTRVVPRGPNGVGPFTAAGCNEVGINGTNLGVPDINGTQPSQGCFGIAQPVNTLEDFNVDNETPTYKVGLNWSPTDTDYFYAFYAKGYKAPSGQGNGVAPESIDDYEFGWKGSLFDGAVTGDLGFYFMDYTDMQGETFVRTNPIGSSFTNSNIADAELMGIEGSFQAYIGDLGINASFAFADSEIGTASDVVLASLPTWANTATAINNGFSRLPQCGVGGTTPSTAMISAGVPNGDCFDYSAYELNFSGQQQIQAPDVSYNLGIDYVFPFGSGTLTPRLDYSYTDENYAHLDQQPYNMNDERSLTNFSLTFENENWTVQAYVRNLADEVYIASARAQVVGYGDPRTYGIRAKYNF
ncbi:MAG: TonB-dependent receptor [Gammaproteobacteria bacterium]|nr:TonB-dependent receptor [Gammaproteobacteria bacterium]